MTAQPPGNSKASGTPGKSDKSFPSRYFVMVYLCTGLLMMWMLRQAGPDSSIKNIPYSEFKEHLNKGEVLECSIASDRITGTVKLKPAPAAPVVKISEPAETAAATAAVKEIPEERFSFATTPVEDPKLVEQLQAAGVKFKGERPSIISEFLWGWIIPLGLMAGLWLLMSRRLASAGQTVFGFGKSKARLAGEKDTGVKFSDVAGCEEAKYELKEVVDFLTNPDRYRALGAKIPKGVLLIGPPGTGKTMLARAVAGEASVPFFSQSGSEFVEMFVGVGASRVRDMFQQAKAKAPCILFIDEMDALGRQRGVHVGNVSDEREQTLNQLLVEMDGFEENTGVIILAATNRPEVLDRALLRPGRFDRMVVVDAPDLKGREAILAVHARGKKIVSDVNLRKIAQSTPGLSGADLANILNEAALLAARRNALLITQTDIEEAVEKNVAGPERKSRVLGEAEKHRVAYHEVGHALVAAFSAHADPVHKISIVPHGHAALGYTMQLPDEEQFLMSYSELIDKIRGMLGGRAAEEIVYQEVSTGAENDLERATALARQMVCVYGMSESIGLVHCAHHQSPYLQPGGGESLQRDCSEETAREIDKEVKNILTHAYETAKAILADHRAQLERVAQELYRREVLDAQTFRQLIAVA